MSAPVFQSRLEVAYLSDVGAVRTENQDACAELQDGSGARLLVVADGMGGHRGGATASRLAVETLAQVFHAGGLSGPDLLREGFLRANERVCMAAQSDAELTGMGTTAVALLFDPAAAQVWVAHVGDSRAYRLRDGVLEQLTRDHSTVAELVSRGLISDAEAANHPRRNEILRSLGVAPEVEVDIAPVDVRENDQLILCSDGLSGVVAGEQIAAVLSRTPPHEAVRLLVEGANALGGPDNVTVMVAAMPGAQRAALPAAEPRGRDLRPVALATAAVAAALLALLAYVLWWGVPR